MPKLYLFTIASMELFTSLVVSEFMPLYIYIKKRLYNSELFVIIFLIQIWWFLCRISQVCWSYVESVHRTSWLRYPRPMTRLFFIFCVNVRSVSLFRPIPFRALARICVCLCACVVCVYVCVCARVNVVCETQTEKERERGLTDIFTPVFAPRFISAELIRTDNNGLGMRGCPMRVPLSTVDVFSQECARSPSVFVGTKRNISLEFHTIMRWHFVTSNIQKY